MARTVLLSRRALKSCVGSVSCAPFGKVNRTAFLSVSATQSMPAWDQTGTPSGFEGFFHFTSSTTPGSARLITARRCASVSLRQSPDFLMMSSICCETDLSCGALFMVPTPVPLAAHEGAKLSGNSSGELRSEGLTGEDGLQGG